MARTSVNVDKQKGIFFQSRRCMLGNIPYTLNILMGNFFADFGVLGSPYILEVAINL